MTTQLLELCDHPLGKEDWALSMEETFPKLHKLAPSRLILPIQESMTVVLPSSASELDTHQPFPHHAPTFQGTSIHFFSGV